MITVPLLTEFAATCELNHVPVPEPVQRGLDILAAAQSFAAPREQRFLNLSDDDLPAVLSDLALREHTDTDRTIGIRAALPKFEEQLLLEIRTETVPLLEDLIADLRDRFDDTVAPIIVAVREHGFTGYTSSSDVLERRNWKDAEAFMAARDAVMAVQPLLSFRQTVSRTFDVAPYGNPVDYSVAFAAGDNWGSSGEFNREHKHPGIVDVVALAAGGLRLNSPTEVESKLQQRRAAEFAVAEAGPVFVESDPDLRLGPVYPAVTSRGI